MNGHEWIVLPVLFAFMLVIIAMHFIVEGFKEVQQEKVGVYYKRVKQRKSKPAKKKVQMSTPSKEDFLLLDEQK